MSVLLIPRVSHVFLSFSPDGARSIDDDNNDSNDRTAHQSSYDLYVRLPGAENCMSFIGCTLRWASFFSIKPS